MNSPRLVSIFFRGWVSLSILWGSEAVAAATAPREDLHFKAEHLAEAAQDSRYFSLPQLERPPAADWQPFVAVGAVDLESDVGGLRGVLLTAGTAKRWRAQDAIELFAFCDQFHGRGENSEQILTPGATLDVPLDLPAPAAIRTPTGYVRHFGVGASYWYRQLGTGSGSLRYWYGGFLLEELDLKDFHWNYTLQGGADAGATGRVDHSADNTYVTPYLGVQERFYPNYRWRLQPWATVGIPLPRGEFPTSITGPGFDISSASSGAEHGYIGDAFMSAGMELQHSGSNISFDIGAAFLYPVVEALTHEGLGRGILLSLRWSPKAHDATSSTSDLQTGW